MKMNFDSFIMSELLNKLWQIDSDVHLMAETNFYTVIVGYCFLFCCLTFLFVSTLFSERWKLTSS